jgi:ribonuclease D
LLVLDSLLWSEVLEAGIGDEVATETAYRLIDALQTDAEEAPPHVRIRGHERLDGLGRRTIEKIALVREDLGRERDLPPQRVLGDKVLLAIAGHRPRSTKELLRFGQTKRLKEEEQSRILSSIGEAIEEGPMEPLARAPSLPPREVTARKNREKRLQAWRKAEAERRDVHEQVVLPSHCIRWLASAAPDTQEAISRVPGLGHARARRYADRLLAVVRGS